MQNKIDTSEDNAFKEGCQWFLNKLLETSPPGPVYVLAALLASFGC